MIGPQDIVRCPGCGRGIRRWNDKHLGSSGCLANSRVRDFEQEMAAIGYARAEHAAPALSKQFGVPVRRGPTSTVLSSAARVTAARQWITCDSPWAPVWAVSLFSALHNAWMCREARSEIRALFRECLDEGGPNERARAVIAAWKLAREGRR